MIELRVRLYVLLTDLFVVCANKIYRFSSWLSYLFSNCAQKTAMKAIRLKRDND